MKEVWQSLNQVSLNVNINAMDERIIKIFVYYGSQIKAHSIRNVSQILMDFWTILYLSLIQIVETANRQDILKINYSTQLTTHQDLLIIFLKQSINNILVDCLNGKLTIRIINKQKYQQEITMILCQCQIQKANQLQLCQRF
ncbi:unnamed protein product [Paramecium sonneborni]|uniref:Uncharacterized protein n=1 Tax=Paramecium sonneborni TaxID=65129 RepID=A0A8S1RMQ2_9CILI|nr:unnamed protein product [Paramecium sonneborni]